VARIINKEEKRLDIARASIELFVTKGLLQTSIDEIAKSAGVAKGTIYLYFKNKDEIVFAIWDMLATRHQEAYQERIQKSMSAKEKILELFNFSECNEEHNKEQILTLYQHFISSMLVDKTGLYTSYFQSFFQRDYDIISLCLEEGIKTGEFKALDIDMFARTIIVFIEGSLIKSKISNLNFQQTQAMLTKHITFLLDEYTRKEPCKN